MFGFQRGTFGICSAEARRKSWRCSVESPSSGLEGRVSSAGFELSQGGSYQRVSELESVLPGRRPGPRKTTITTR